MRKKFTANASSRLAIVSVILIAGFASLVISRQQAAQGSEGNASWEVSSEKTAVANPVPADENSVSSGKDVYEHRCKVCHGASGRGDGSAGQNLEKKVPDFTDPSVLAKQTDGALFYKITEGRKPMPAYKKTLTDEERWQVVNYIRTFSSSSKDSGKS